MKGKKHSPEQIIAKLREAEAELNGGTSIPQVCQKLAVSEQTFHRWRNQYGGMKADAAKRLRELEEENRRLKSAVADLTWSAPQNWYHPLLSKPVTSRVVDGSLASRD